MRFIYIISYVVVLMSLFILSANSSEKSEQENYSHGYIFNDCDDADWCPRMIVIKGGTFEMRLLAAKQATGEGSPHKVTLKTFAAGRYEVSVGEYQACVNAGKCRWPQWLEKESKHNIRTGSDSIYKILGKSLSQSKSPVVGVSWDDAHSYVVWLSSKTGQKYRLLTEAEWEYAARGGTETRYWWGDNISRDHANYQPYKTIADYSYNRTLEDYAKYGEPKKLVPVDSYQPNSFGLYNVHGNVWEWVADCWHESYNGAPVDGSVWKEDGGGDCSLRITRGGAWVDPPERLHVRIRGRIYQSFRGLGVGFRVAREL